MSQIKREKLVLVTYYTTARSDDDLIPAVILFHGKSKEFARQVINSNLNTTAQAPQARAKMKLNYKIL